MSVDSSPESPSRTRSAGNSRYDRAAQQAVAPIDRKPLPDQRASQREATRTQAEQDRAGRQAEREKLRGKAAEIDDISAL